jgi:hypothetical protein
VETVSVVDDYREAKASSTSNPVRYRLVGDSGMAFGTKLIDQEGKTEITGIQSIQLRKIEAGSIIMAAVELGLVQLDLGLGYVEVLIPNPGKSGIPQKVRRIEYADGEVWEAP